MAWNNENVRTLIDKFWEGETSIEEESLLRQHLQSEHLPEEFEGVAAYFESLEEPAELGPEFDQQFLDAIAAPPKIHFLTSRRWLSAAAILVALSAGYWFFQDRSNPTLSETYTQAEIDEAWEQTQMALKKIGVELNEAQQKTLKIKKFNEAKMAIQFGK